MSYEKLSPEKFAENMKSGRYANLTGARRAIGKAEWADAIKDKVRTSAEKHFGTGTPAVAAATPKKTAAPKTVAKAPVAKKAAAAPTGEPKKRGRPAGVKNVKKADSTEKFGRKAASMSQTGVTLSDEQFERLLGKFADIAKGSGPRADEASRLIAAISTINSSIKTLTDPSISLQLDLTELQQSVDMSFELTRALKAQFNLDSPTPEAEVDEPVISTQSNGKAEGSYYQGSASSAPS